MIYCSFNLVYNMNIFPVVALLRQQCIEPEYCNELLINS
jgi:hypothetical protein